MKTLEVLGRVLKGKRIKHDTERHYRDALGSLARYSEDWPVSGVVVNEWLGSLKGYSDMTVRNWFNFVNSAGKYMKKAYKLDNPCEDADRPRVSKKRRRYFTAEELGRIIKACRLEQDLPLVLTLIDSTCRIGELVGLEAKNVGDGWIDVQGKTGQRRYRCDVRICRELCRLGDGGKPIFTGRFGGVADVNSLKHRVRRVIKEAGITGSKLGAHTLRHSGASLVAQETGSALAVKALLQHDKIDTSMEYIHDAEDVIQQRISPLGLVLERLSGGVDLEPLQLVMGGQVVEDEISTAVVPVEGGIVEVVDLVDDMFPEIKDGVKVRSVFNADDLRLLREAFVGYVRTGRAGSSELKLRYLMKRMLRKAKN
ncbi:Tyrosine recombinase XerC [subsurface metagenome]